MTTSSVFSCAMANVIKAEACIVINTIKYDPSELPTVLGDLKCLNHDLTVLGCDILAGDANSVGGQLVLAGAAGNIVADLGELYYDAGVTESSTCNETAVVGIAWSLACATGLEIYV